MRKWLCLLLAAVLAMSAGAFGAFAEETEETFHVEVREPGFCGEDVRWIYADGVLTLEGSGRMDDFPDGAPWADYKQDIRELELQGSITYIGAYAFTDYDALEILRLGDSLTEIGMAAFSGCDGLTAAELPASFRIFGKEAFSHCKNLTEFYFHGGFPKFKLNCMWDTYAKLFYPAERPWPLEHIQQLEEAFQGRIEFLASDGTDPYVPEQETEAPEETKETVPPTTEAQTEPVTVPTEAPTEAPTEVQTEAPTEETAAATTETVPPTTEEYVVLPEPEEELPAGMDSGLSLPVAGLIFLMVVSGGGALFLMGRMAHNQKKDFAGNFSEILLEDERKSRKKPAAKGKTAGKNKSRRGGKYSR